MSSIENKRIRRKVRSAYAISTVSIAMVLFLLGSVGYFIIGALGASDRLRESVAVTVMLDSDITPGRTDSIGRRLSELEGVKSSRFVSREEAAADFKDYLKDDFEEFLGANPLPDAFEITLEADFSSRDQIAALEKEIVKWNGVNELVYQRNVVDEISSNINKFNMVLLMFGAALIVISLVLLGNTIRVAIFSKRNIINTMKLVGATRGFIMKPFMASAVRQGIIAGLISWAMLVLMIAGMYEGLPEIRLVSENLHLACIFGAMMAGGILISLVFTWISVRMFLRMNSSNTLIY